MIFRTGSLIGLCLLFFNHTVSAATATGALSISAVVLEAGGINACTFNSSASNMFFPTYFSFNANTDDATAFLEITCGKKIPYDVGIDQGHGPGATVYSRLMTKSGTNNTLRYNLFKNSNFTNYWGNTIGQNTLHLIGTALAQRIPVYGEIPAKQTVAPGRYSDRVIISVTF